MFLSLEVRSYDGENPYHQHDHVQLVLPLRGRMDIDVDGRGECIDQSMAALVAPGSVHSQLTDTDSRFLVLDCAPTHLEQLPESLVQLTHAHVRYLSHGLVVPVYWWRVREPGEPTSTPAT